MPGTDKEGTPCVAAPEIPAGRRPWWLRLLVPTLSDTVFALLMAIMFMSGAGWSLLLVDGDSGLHIRTGDYILRAGRVPHHDLFSFFSPQASWYAWEWLSDVIFSVAHQIGGLKGVVLLSAATVCVALLVLFRHMIWRGIALHIAVAMTILVADALRFHFLARPHIFTTLLTVVSFCILDRDWIRPSRTAWLLIPLTILWTNMHGGFLVLLVSLALFTSAALLRRDSGRAWRYGSLAAACSACTLINPYFWRLHVHIWEYLRSGWLPLIEEFRSPEFHTEPMLKFEILLFLGLLSIAGLARERRYHHILLILFWAHAALGSVRHVTVYALMAAVPIAQQFQALWEGWTERKAAGSIAGSIRDLVAEFQPAASRSSLWVAIFLVVLASGGLGGNWPADFPKELFPSDLLSRNAGLLTGPGHEQDRILNPDGWGGFLAYHLYPQRREFMDGRSDFFGPEMLHEYASLRGASDNWKRLMAEYRFRFVLIPPGWPLAETLRHTGEWMLRDEDAVAVLFESRGATASAR